MFRSTHPRSAGSIHVDNPALINTLTLQTFLFRQPHILPQLRKKGNDGCAIPPQYREGGDDGTINHVEKFPRMPTPKYDIPHYAADLRPWVVHVRTHRLREHCECRYTYLVPLRAPITVHRGHRLPITSNRRSSPPPLALALPLFAPACLARAASLANVSCSARAAGCCG